MRVALNTMGCKLNQAETEILACQFASAGFNLVAPSEDADIYILNTCTVTRTADSKARRWLRMAHRRNPSALVVSLGCYAQRSPRELERIEGVDLVVGNEDKLRLLDILEGSGYLPGFTPPCNDSSDNNFRTRAFIKVQDGCRSFCTYCIVPLVRNQERSVPAECVTSEIKTLVAAGYKEVVLTGVKVGTYLSDGIDLAGLLARILGETEVARLRISSLQPQEISHNLISMWRDSRLCRHFHLSLQSGSDSVLERMERRYSTRDYLKAITLIRGMVPGMAITTDIIVGFPGETDAEFEDSFRFCRYVGFSRIHVFSYSSREGTKAAGMMEQVKDTAKKQRSREMLALAKESLGKFNSKFLGKDISVLWENEENGFWAGYTDNYIKVYAKSDKDLTNKLSMVNLTGIRGEGARGDLLT
ncbi:tRNA (N(6)-L-threonylcarbamoyladenosine(37)-C(2))-methylthiotransferase MtaB [Chloroflexota bacterium]